MRNTLILAFLLSGLTLIMSCSSDSEEEPEPDDLIVNDFTAFIDENPESGEVIGTIDASTTTGELSFSIINQMPSGAISVDESSGEILVNDESLFVFADNTQISATIDVTNGDETKDLTATINIREPGAPNFNIWTGSKITFTKEDNANPENEAKQDRITDNVWITRGNDGGRIFNIKVESSATKTTSPEDTEWARGTTANLSGLSFNSFDQTVDPKNDVGDDFVMHLITDDVYIDIRFTSWTQGKSNGGGFSYERASEN